MHAPPWGAFVRDAAARSNAKRLVGFMYIAEELAHLVVTPFLGGFHVELHEGIYYCPVRAAQDTVDAALCRYCPAVQSREQDMMLTKQQQEFIEREEKTRELFPQLSRMSMDLPSPLFPQDQAISILTHGNHLVMQ